MKQFIFVIACLAFATIAHAQSTSVASGQTKTVDAHGVCKKVRNTGGSTFFVPYRTSAEWSAFRSNKPGNSSLLACGPTCGGVSLGGYCWYAGPMDSTIRNCDTICASRGGCNASGIQNYVGQNGSDANCRNVLNALGKSGPHFIQQNDPALYGGCIALDYTILGTRLQRYERNVGRVARCNEPATTYPASIKATRACSCNN